MRSSFSLFRSVRERELTGRMPSNWPGRQPSPSPAAPYIAEYPTQRKNPERQLSLMLEIKNIAMHGDAVAAQFLLDTLINPKTSIELRPKLVTCLNEIADFTRDAELFYKLFELLIWESISLLTPNPREAMDALVKAAHASGVNATKAACLLAYLYGRELGYANTGNAPQYISFSAYYTQFRSLETNYMRKLAGTEAFAELGCTAAINDLILPLIICEDSENANVSTQLQGHWEKAARNNRQKLTAYFEKYFELAFQNVCRYGRPPARDDIHPDNFMCIIQMQTRHLFEKHRRQSPNLMVYTVTALDEIKDELIKAANQGSLHAAEFLATEAEKANRNGFAFERNAATFWNQYIFKTAIPDCAIVHRAGRRLLRKHIETPAGAAHPDYTHQELAQLTASYHLGCTHSAVDLGSFELRRNDFNQAVNYFNFALMRTSEPWIFQSLATALINHGCHKETDQLIYFYQIIARWLKSGAHNYFPWDTIIYEINQLAEPLLMQLWLELSKLNPKKIHEHADTIDSVIDKTAIIMSRYYMPKNTGSSTKRIKLDHL